VTDNAISLINRLHGEYTRCIDNGNLESWPDFFEEDCIYKITTADNHAQGLEAGLVFANSRGMLRDRVASLREANIYERHTYRHFLSLPWIASKDAALIRSETSFFVARIMRDGSTDVYATGPILMSWSYRDQTYQFASALLCATVRGSILCWRCPYERVP
jgi:anthranilate 1,2-dioxygenase small subunit